MSRIVQRTPTSEIWPDTKSVLVNGTGAALIGMNSNFLYGSTPTNPYGMNSTNSTHNATNLNQTALPHQRALNTMINSTLSHNPSVNNGLNQTLVQNIALANTTVPRTINASVNRRPVKTLALLDRVRKLMAAETPLTAHHRLQGEADVRNTHPFMNSTAEVDELNGTETETSLNITGDEEGSSGQVKTRNNRSNPLVVETTGDKNKNGPGWVGGDDDNDNMYDDESVTVDESVAVSRERRSVVRTETDLRNMRAMFTSDLKSRIWKHDYEYQPTKSIIRRALEAMGEDGEVRGVREIAAFLNDQFVPATTPKIANIVVRSALELLEWNNSKNPSPINYVLRYWDPQPTYDLKNFDVAALDEAQFVWSLLNTFGNQSLAKPERAIKIQALPRHVVKNLVRVIDNVRAPLFSGHPQEPQVVWLRKVSEKLQKFDQVARQPWQSNSSQSTVMEELRDLLQPMRNGLTSGEDRGIPKNHDVFYIFKEEVLDTLDRAIKQTAKSETKESSTV